MCSKPRVHPRPLTLGTALSALLTPDGRGKCRWIPDTMVDRHPRPLRSSADRMGPQHRLQRTFSQLATSYQVTPRANSPAFMETVQPPGAQFLGQPQRPRTTQVVGTEVLTALQSTLTLAAEGATISTPVRGGSTVHTRTGAVRAGGAPPLHQRRTTGQNRHPASSTTTARGLRARAGWLRPPASLSAQRRPAPRRVP